MLEVKLKEIIETNVIDVKEGIQFWQNKNGSRLITTVVCDDKVRVYYLNDEPRTWVEDTFAAFEKTIINELEFRECDEEWNEYMIVENDLHIKNVETLEEITGVKYWKSTEGNLYMTNYNLDEHVPAMITRLNDCNTITEIFENVSALIKRMEHLNLYKVHNMRLEEF